MEYLGLALYAEGPTDYYFLRPLLRRLCTETCLTHAQRPVDIPDVLALDHPPKFAEAERERRVVEAAREATGFWRLLFVHADGAGDERKARATQVEPALALLQDEIPQAGEGIAVVPVREMESWTLVDGDALRKVFGLALSDAEFGIDMRRASIESIKDPKRLLDAIFAATYPTPRLKKAGVSPLLDSLGEEVSIDRLRDLPSFAALERELQGALRRLAIIE